MERVVSVIPGGSAGFLGSKTFDLVVTTERLILAKTAPEMQKEAIKKARDESKEKGEGFLKQAAAQMKSSTSLHERFYGMSPENILSENEANVSIDLPSIKSIKLRDTSSTDPSNAQSQQTMVIKWVGGKMKLTYENLSISDAREILRQQLGKIVK